MGKPRFTNFSIEKILDESTKEDRECDCDQSCGFSKAHRRRSTFSAIQVHILEAEFYQNRYVSPERRAALATFLGLSQQQVKIWFQNRRYKTKTKPEGSKPRELFIPSPINIWLMQKKNQLIPPFNRGHQLSPIHFYNFMAQLRQPLVNSGATTPFNNNFNVKNN